MNRAGILFLFPLLIACGDPPPPEESEPVKTAGRKNQNTCQECEAVAGRNHVCGKSRYCDACMRDVLQNHTHRRTQPCLDCGREVGENHTCDYTKVCRKPTCSRSGRTIEGGDGHVCGKTFFCRMCKKDGALDGPHNCRSQTYFCPRCENEVKDGEHACSKSYFCGTCKQERGTKKHDCYRSRFCLRCSAEMPMRHTHKNTDHSDTPEKIENP